MHAVDPLDAAGLAATVERHGLTVTSGPADVTLVSAMPVDTGLGPPVDTGQPAVHSYYEPAG